MAETYAVLHGSYATLQIGIFNDDHCIAQNIITDTRASSHILTSLDTLLQSCNKTLSDLSYIIIDRGPGAFTSLRVTVATANGIGFATKKPLIGVSGLDGLILDLQEKNLNQKNMTLALLNAYNNDVYYRFSPEKTLSGLASIGCSSITTLLNQLATIPNTSWHCAGNGATLHQELIMQLLPTAHIDAHLQIPTLASLAKLGRSMWHNTTTQTHEIEPLYLKTQLFAIKQ